MAYYWFDSIAEEKTKDIESICNKVSGICEYRNMPPDKEWLGYGKISLIRYTPKNKLQILIQCWPEYNYNTPEVSYVLKQIAKLSNTCYFYDGGIIDQLKLVDVEKLE